jgi:SRSO17 transposase
MNNKVEEKMFRLKRIPLKIELMLNVLQSFFNDYQWLHFKSLILSLLLTPYKRTLNGIIKILLFGGHRTKQNEFLIDCSKILSKVLRFYAMLIITKLKRTKEPIYVIIDDTTNKKRGKHIEAAFSFFDHISKNYIWGQQIVCVIIQYRGMVIPYAIEVYVPKEKVAEVGVQFKKKTKIAEEILRTFEVDKDQEVYVLSDTYYATTGIMNFCRGMGYTFISMLKSNRIIKVKRGNTNVEKYIKSTFSRKKNKKVMKIGNNKYQIYRCDAILKSGGAVQLVFTKHLSHRTVKVVFTTNTALPIKKILEAYKIRWSIELFFKMSKQYLGLKSYQNRDLNATKSFLSLSLFTYNLLTHVFIEDLREKGLKLTKKNIAHFSIIGTRDHIRNIACLDTIEYCIENYDNISKNKFMIQFKKLLLAA